MAIFLTLLDLSTVKISTKSETSIEQGLAEFGRRLRAMTPIDVIEYELFKIMTNLNIDICNTIISLCSLTELYQLFRGTPMLEFLMIRRNVKICVTFFELETAHEFR